MGAERRAAPKPARIPGATKRPLRCTRDPAWAAFAKHWQLAADGQRMAGRVWLNGEQAERAASMTRMAR